MDDLKTALKILQDGEDEFESPNGVVIITDYEKVYKFMNNNNIDNLIMPEFGEPIEDSVAEALSTVDNRFDFSITEGFTKRSILENRRDNINIKWQKGTVKDNGINGVQIDDVISVVMDRLTELDKMFPSEQNRQTLKHLAWANYWQAKRTLDRVERGVEGQNVE